MFRNGELALALTWTREFPQVSRLDSFCLCTMVIIKHLKKHSRLDLWQSLK